MQSAILVNDKIFRHFVSLSITKFQNLYCKGEGHAIYKPIQIKISFGEEFGLDLYLRIFSKKFFFQQKVTDKNS